MCISVNRLGRFGGRRGGGAEGVGEKSQRALVLWKMDCMAMALMRHLAGHSTIAFSVVVNGDSFGGGAVPSPELDACHSHIANFG